MTHTKWPRDHLVALILAAVIGAIPGFAAGVWIETQYLQSIGLLERVYDAGLDAPFLRVGGVFALIGAIMGTGVVWIVKLLRV